MVRASFAQFLLLEDSAPGPAHRRAVILAAAAPAAHAAVKGLASPSVRAWQRSSRASAFLGADDSAPQGAACELPLLGVKTVARWHGHPLSFTAASKAAEGKEHDGKAAKGDAGGGDEPHFKGSGGVRMLDVAGFAGFLLVSSIVGGALFAYLKWSKPKARAGDGEEVRQSGSLPTLAIARAMPTGMAQCSNEVLIQLSEQGIHGACAERLIREAMRVDGVDWVTAKAKVTLIDAYCTKLMEAAILPYMVGIGACVVGGVASVPLVFNKTLAEWTNHHFVTSEVPEPRELDTIWEVSSWTWNWMEPFLGTAAFVILCVQLTRSMMSEIEMLSYHERIKIHNANMLADKFPQYSREIVRAYGKTASLHKEAHLED